MSIHIFILPHDLSSLSCLCTLDFPSWMRLICPVPCGSARIVGTHTVCCVMYLPSSGLWCFSQGWQRFYQLTSFIMWPHGHCSRSRVSQSFPGASKFLQSTLRCSSNAFQFMPGALQYFLARSCVTLLPSAQAPAWSLWCVCLTHACNMSFFCWWLCVFIWLSPDLLGQYYSAQWLLKMWKICTKICLVCRLLIAPYKS